MVIEKFVRGLNRLIKIIFWELVIRPIRIPKLENLSCKIFNGESAVYSEGLLKEFSEKANWFRGAVYPQFPASFAAQEVERRNFYNFLEGICRRNFTDKLGLTELEIVIFSWL